MGTASSHPGKRAGGSGSHSKSHHRGNGRSHQQNGWTQHYQNHSRTVTQQANPVCQQEVQPTKPSSIAKNRLSPGGIVIQQTTVTQPAAPMLMSTTTTTTRTMAQQPAGQKQRGRGGKPKIDYSTVECGVCGHTGHGTRFCHHRNQTCHICFEQGHIASVCKQKVHHEGSRYKPGAPRGKSIRQRK